MLLFTSEVEFVCGFQVVNLFKYQFFENFGGTTKVSNGSIIFNFIFNSFFKNGDNLRYLPLIWNYTSTVNFFKEISKGD